MSSLPSGISYTANRSDFDIHALQEAMSQSGSHDGDIVIYARKVDGVSSNTEYSLVAPKGGDNEKEKGSRVAIESFTNAMSIYWGDNKVLQSVIKALIGVESDSLDATASSSLNPQDARVKSLTLGKVNSIIQEMQELDWRADVSMSIRMDPGRFMRVHQKELAPLAVNILEACMEIQNKLREAKLSENLMCDLKGVVEVMLSLLKEGVFLSDNKEIYLENRKLEFGAAKLLKEFWPSYEEIFSSHYDERSVMMNSEVRSGLRELLLELHEEIRSRPESVLLEWGNGGNPICDDTGVYNLASVIESLKDARFGLSTEFVKSAVALLPVAENLSRGVARLIQQGVEKDGAMITLGNLQSISPKNEMARIIFLAKEEPKKGLVLLKNLEKYFSTEVPELKSNDLSNGHIWRFFGLSIGNWVGNIIPGQTIDSMLKRQPPISLDSANKPDKSRLKAITDGFKDNLILLDQWISQYGEELKRARLRLLM